MAIIGKIRKKSGLLVGIVGLALATFILSDYQHLLGINEGQYGIGTVYGEKVDPKDYNMASAKFQEQGRNQAMQNNKEFTDADMETANDNSWNYLVDSTILSKEYEALGISVSEREFNAYLMATDGFNIIQDLNQFFVDSTTGAISPQSMVEGRKKLQTTLNKLKTSKEPQAVQQWNGTKQYYTDTRKREKYFGLLDQAAYVTNLEAEDKYYSSKETKSISFVFRPYSDIADADVKVSESEIKAYYDEHKGDKKYAIRSSSREVKVFDVVVAPSKADTTKMNKLLNELKAGFITSTNDSLYVLRNSDVKIYFNSKRSTAVPEGNPKANQYQTYPISYDTIFKLASVGQVVGPYSMKENMVISKVIGFTPSRLKARHILLSTNGSKDAKVIEAKRKTADSLLKIVNKENFTALSDKFSDDTQSKKTGGVIDNFLEGDMVPEFGSYCATAPLNKFGVVKTEFGFHIVEVMERDASKLPVLVSISKQFKASEETISNKESEINNILYKLDRKVGKTTDILKKVSVFDTIVRQANYVSRSILLEDRAPKAYGFMTTMAADKILELAYSDGVEVGSLTTYPIKDKDKYIIGMVTSIKEEGEPTYENVKAEMERELITEKKAKRFMNQMSKGNSLKSVAKKCNLMIQTAEITFANPQIANVGYEPEIIGMLFSSVMKNGKRTLPLKGKSGVYMIQIMKTTKAPASTVFKVEKDEMTKTLKGSFQGQVMGALRKKAEVIDNRKLNELRLRM